MLIDEIRSFLTDYFDVLQTQDMAMFDRVFHKDCVLYSQQDNAMVVRPLRPIAPWCKGVRRQWWATSHAARSC
jgi:hypothetical protein